MKEQCITLPYKLYKFGNVLRLKWSVEVSSVQRLCNVFILSLYLFPMSLNVIMFLPIFTTRFSLTRYVEVFALKIITHTIIYYRLILLNCFIFLLVNSNILISTFHPNEFINELIHWAFTWLGEILFVSCKQRVCYNAVSNNAPLLLVLIT